MNKNKKIILVAVAVVVLFLGLLWYYQQQGFVRIFPTAQEWQMRRALTIDESRFVRAEGLTDEMYEAKLEELQLKRQDLRQNLYDPDLWFEFGELKSFFNDHEGATKAWEAAFSIQPDFRLAINLANAYQYFIKDYPTAEDYYLASLELQPGLGAAYRGLMDLYRFNWQERSGQYEDLVLLAIQHDGQNSLFYYRSLVEFFVSDEYRDDEKARYYVLQVKQLNEDMAQEFIENYPQLQ